MAILTTERIIRATVKSALCILFTLVAAKSVLAADTQLILLAREIDIKSHQPVTLEIFLYNPNSKPAHAPVLEEYSIVSATKDATGKLTAGGGTQSKGISELLSLQTLQPKSIQHKTIRAEINNIRAGEFAEVFVEIGWERKLRSNSILLLCPK